LENIYQNLGYDDRINCYNLVPVSWDNSANKLTGYELDDRGSTPDSGRDFLSSQQRPDWFWGPPKPLLIAHRG